MSWHRGSSRKPHRDSARDKARDRLMRFSNADVLDWSEQAVNGVHQTLDALRHGPDPAALQEARQAVSMLSGALDVLEHRQRE